MKPRLIFGREGKRFMFLVYHQLEGDFAVPINYYVRTPP